MLQQKKNIRIWSITVTWKNNTQTLRKEFIVTAPDDKKAKQQVVNRLPSSFIHQPNKQADIRIRDLGNVENEKTYLSSDPFIPNIRQEDALQYERVILYAKLLGAEIGWRTTNQNTTPQDDIYLRKINNEPNWITILTEWAEKSLYLIDKTPEEFFNEKMSEYLGTKVINITEIVPVNDSGYERTIKNAELQAQKIKYNAITEADKIKQEASKRAQELEEEAKRKLDIAEKMLNTLGKNTNISSPTEENPQKTQYEPNINPTNDPNDKEIQNNNDNDQNKPTESPIQDHNDPTDVQPSQDDISQNTDQPEEEMITQSNIISENPAILQPEYNPEDDMNQIIEEPENQDELLGEPIQESETPNNNTPQINPTTQPPIITPKRSPMERSEPAKQPSNASAELLLKQHTSRQIELVLESMTITINDEIHPANIVWPNWRRLNTPPLKGNAAKKEKDLKNFIISFIKQCDPSTTGIPPLQYAYYLCTNTIQILDDIKPID